jgi:hypothetical protein
MRPPHRVRFAAPGGCGRGSACRAPFSSVNLKEFWVEAPPKTLVTNGYECEGRLWAPESSTSGNLEDARLPAGIARRGGRRTDYESEGHRRNEMPPRLKVTDGSGRDRARRLLASLRDVSLESYSVVGHCLRFDERSRNTLKEFRQRLAESFFSKSPTPKNFLCWGAPGSGKSYLVQQTAKSLPSEVHYHELNLAQLDSSSLRSGLDSFVAAHGPGLCFIDEVDARSDQAWPYETLLPYLDPSVPRRFPTAFCLAGSGGRNLKELTERIRGRPKGSDLLSPVLGHRPTELMMVGFPSSGVDGAVGQVVGPLELSPAGE